ncbi:MAG: nucleotidyl transferase AbiEii/AbiGii toxin family protein [Coriobacteriia bacterium]|nr:nucleotidyl transferase AbiEii/AbiGii toxin family protein [Coriobacteriia bacterium]
MARKNNLAANTVLQNYMMERFLERVSESPYCDNFILKGGFLIAAMIGIDLRSTIDIDATIKGVPVSEAEILKIISEIVAIPAPDNVSFEIKSIKPIHPKGEYEDFRLGLVATFFTMRTDLKLDITTGDVIVPREVDYSYKLMLEDRAIRVKAYNLNTILAEKIESILARNVANTRARDYYDAYILLTTRQEEIDSEELLDAIKRKAEERGTLRYIEQYEKYLTDIHESQDLLSYWQAYRRKYPYAEGIEYSAIVDTLTRVFK